MNLVIIYLIGLIFFVRGLTLAIGKVKKIYKNENFLTWQKVSAFLIAIPLVWNIILNLKDDLSLSKYFVFELISLFLLGIFYLQPTPRISKYILIILISMIIISLIYTRTFFIT